MSTDPTAAVSEAPRPGPLVGARGAVSAGDTAAAAAAAAVFDRGGNAVDAALAGALVQTVVEPPWCSIGGDAFVLIATPEGEVVALNGSGLPPAGIVDRLGAGQRAPRFGPLSVATPGFVGAWFAVHERFASMSTRDLLEPAIRIARNGFVLEEGIAAVIAQVEGHADDDTRAGLEPMLRYPARRAGEIFVQSDLADTLERIAVGGAREFYEGETAKRIVTALEQRGGVLSLADLAAHEARFTTPIETRYRGHRVLANPPVSFGTVLLEELAIARELDLRRFGPGSVESIDAMVWCKQAAFADVSRLGDGPDARATAEALIAPARAARWAGEHTPGAAAEMQRLIDIEGGLDTTSIATADAEGYTAVVIHSVFNEFGAREVADGTGVLMNDRLASLRVDGGAPNGLQIGRRPLHTLNAYLVLDDAGVALVAGATPGGRGQVQTNFQVLSHIFDFDLDLQSAVEQPRWLSGTPRTATLDDALLVEQGMPLEITDGLRRLGYAVRIVDTSVDRASSDLFGGVTLVGRNPAGRLTAAADPRRRVAAEVR